MGNLKIKGGDIELREDGRKGWFERVNRSPLTEKIFKLTEQEAIEELNTEENPPPED